MTSEPMAIIPAHKAISAILDIPLLPTAMRPEHDAAAIPVKTASSGDIVPIILFSCNIGFIFPFPFQRLPVAM